MTDEAVATELAARLHPNPETEILVSGSREHEELRIYLAAFEEEIVKERILCYDRPEYSLFINFLYPPDGGTIAEIGIRNFPKAATYTYIAPKK